MRHLALASVLLVAAACSEKVTEPPPDPVVASIIVTIGSTDLASLGETTVASAEGRDSEGAPIPGLGFAWSSSDPAVAMVSAGGLVTAHGNGTATITASFGDVAGSVNMAVSQVAVSASVQPSDGVYKSAAQLTGSALDARDNVMDDVVTWTSLSPGIVTVDSTGAITPVSTGVARIEVEAGGFTDTATVRMVWNVTQLDDLFPLSEFEAMGGGGSVFSDLSQAHADEHAAIYDEAWTFLTDQFSATTLTQKDFYFTAWTDIWIEYNPFCGGVLRPNQTNWQRCGSPYPRSFLTPEQQPDFRNLVRFLTHEVLRFTYSESDAIPWFKEGLAFWYGSGSFQAGDLVTTAPEAVFVADFNSGDSQGILEPIDSLTTMVSAEFYADLPTRTPVAVRMAQATMLVGYLALNFDIVLADAIAGINDGSIATNADLWAQILGDTGLSSAQLEAAYLAYARGL